MFFVAKLREGETKLFIDSEESHAIRLDFEHKRIYIRLRQLNHFNRRLTLTFTDLWKWRDLDSSIDVALILRVEEGVGKRWQYVDVRLYLEPFFVALEQCGVFSKLEAKGFL